MSGFIDAFILDVIWRCSKVFSLVPQQMLAEWTNRDGLVAVGRGEYLSLHEIEPRFISN
jgi:hypothetical protein